MKAVPWRPLRVAIYITCAVGVTMGGFTFAHYELDRSTARAGIPAVIPTENVPGPSETPLPGAPPDTTKPLWGVPYLNEDRQKPRFNQEVNGIKIGPDVEMPSDGRCLPGEAKYVPPPAPGAAAVALGILTLPPGSILEADRAVSCAGAVVSVEREYAIVAAPEAEAKIRSGAASWFQTQHGGRLTILKALRPFPAQQSQVASERIRPTTINGHPALIGRPILADDFGDSIIVVWDDA